MRQRLLLENGVDALLLENGEALRLEQEFVERPKVVTGPFPFPKEKPAFHITTADVTVALSGIAATVAIGTLATVLSLGLSGVEGTGATGTITAGNDVVAALTGVEGTSSIGSLGGVSDVFMVERPRIVRGPFPFPKALPDFPISVPTAALIGQTGTGAVGTLGVSLDVGLSGVSATVGQGTILAGTDATVGLTGVAGTGSPGTLTGTSTVALSGVTGTGLLRELTVQGAVIVVDRPHRVDGPIPFLPSGMFQFRSKLPPVLPPSSRLIGYEVIGSTGTLTPGVTVSAIGIVGTGATGALGIGQGLAGVTVQGSINGFATRSITVGLSGVVASGAVGDVGAISGAGAALTGVEATTAEGAVASPAIVEVRLSGVDTEAGVNGFVISGPPLPFLAQPDVVIDIRPSVGFIDVRASAQIIEVQ